MNSFQADSYGSPRGSAKSAGAEDEIEDDGESILYRTPPLRTVAAPARRLATAGFTIKQEQPVESLATGIAALRQLLNEPRAGTSNADAIEDSDSEEEREQLDTIPEHSTSAALQTPAAQPSSSRLWEHSGGRFHREARVQRPSRLGQNDTALNTPAGPSARLLASSSSAEKSSKWGSDGTPMSAQQAFLATHIQLDSGAVKASSARRPTPKKGGLLASSQLSNWHSLRSRTKAEYVVCGRDWTAVESTGACIKGH